MVLPTTQHHAWAAHGAMRAAEKRISDPPQNIEFLDTVGHGLPYYCSPLSIKMGRGVGV
jgi:hypothetical protein